MGSKCRPVGRNLCRSCCGFPTIFSRALLTNWDPRETDTYNLSFIIHKWKPRAGEQLAQRCWQEPVEEMDWNAGPLPPRVLCCLRSQPIDWLNWKCGGWDQLFELVLLEGRYRALLGFDPRPWCLGPLAPTITFLEPGCRPSMCSRIHPEEKHIRTWAQSPLSCVVMVTEANTYKCPHTHSETHRIPGYICTYLLPDGGKALSPKGDRLCPAVLPGR